PQASEAERAWEWVKDTTNQAVLENFIKQFSNTEYGDRARSRLEELKKQEQVAREEAKRKLEAEAEKKRLADEAERKRLAALKSEEDRRLEAEARARAREEAERKRLASLKTEDDRKNEAIGSKSVSYDNLVLELSSGKVVIRLRPDLAPKHVEQIKRLTSQGFYNGIIFHRVIAGFMAQTGDPTGTGTGGSSPICQPSSRKKSTSAAVLEWRARSIQTALIASSLFASARPAVSSRDSTPCG